MNIVNKDTEAEEKERLLAEIEREQEVVYREAFKQFCKDELLNATGIVIEKKKAAEKAVSLFNELTLTRLEELFNEPFCYKDGSPKEVYMQNVLANKNKS